MSREPAYSAGFKAEIEAMRQRLYNLYYRAAIKKGYNDHKARETARENANRDILHSIDPRDGEERNRKALESLPRKLKGHFDIHKPVIEEARTRATRADTLRDMKKRAEKIGHRVSIGRKARELAALRQLAQQLGVRVVRIRRPTARRPRK